jgi:hypothetical protein
MQRINENKELRRKCHFFMFLKRWYTLICKWSGGLKWTSKLTTLWCLRQKCLFIRRLLSFTVILCGCNLMWSIKTLNMNNKIFQGLYFMSSSIIYDDAKLLLYTGDNISMLPRQYLVSELSHMGFNIAAELRYEVLPRKHRFSIILWGWSLVYIFLQRHS